jgi:hypothetical protein
MVSRYCSQCGQTTRWRPNVRVVEGEIGLPNSKLALAGGVAMRKIRGLRMAIRVVIGAMDRRLHRTGLISNLLMTSTRKSVTSWED